MTKVFRGLGFTLCVLSGCTLGKTPNSAPLDAPGAGSPSCPQGIYSTFVLAAKDALPASTQFPYSFAGHGGGDDDPRPVPLFFLAPGTNSTNVELRLCLDSSTFKVQKVLSLVQAYSDTEWSSANDTVELKWNESWVVRGLDEAIFQDYSQLEILAQEKPDTFYPLLEGAIHIRGWQVDGRSYVTAGRAQYRGDGESPMQPPDVKNYSRKGVLVGDLVQGEIAKVGECKSYEQFSSVTFRAGTAKFRVQQCAFDSLDSRNYRILKIQIKDSNPALAQPLNISLNENELSDKLLIARGHHMYGLGFRLDLQEASYIAMDLVGGDGGYDVSIPDGPTYEEITQILMGGSKISGVFRSRYAQGAWSSTERTTTAKISSGGESRVSAAGVTPLFKVNDELSALNESCLLPAGTTIDIADSSRLSIEENGRYTDYLTFEIEAAVAACPTHLGRVAIRRDQITLSERSWD